MKLLNQVLKYARAFGKKDASHGHAHITSPARDWTIVLYTSVFATLALAAFAFWFYARGGSDVGLPAAAGQSVVLSEERLGKTLQKYQADAIEHEALLNATSTIADPAVAQ